MKLRLLILVFLINTLAHFASAQDSILIINPKPTASLEILLGNTRLYNQIIINKIISKNKRVGLFNISSFISDYNSEISKNEYLSSTLLYYSVLKRIGVNAGVTFNSLEGLKPYFGLQYLYANKKVMFIFLPSYYYKEGNKISGLASIEYKPKIHKKMLLFTKLQAYYAYNPLRNSHIRSYIFARVGISYSNLTFGMGINQDWYGERKIGKNNYGLFLKINL